MSATFDHITDATLHAYVDGKLPLEQRSRVEEFLAGNPGKAAEVALWQRQNETLSALFGAVAQEPVPARLKPHVIAARRAAPRFSLRQVAAAAVVLIALGSTVGWFGRDVLSPAESASDLLIDSAVTAHALYVKESRHAVEVEAKDRDHLVSWLSNRIGQPIGAPDLASQGFNLVGGRLLPAGPYPDKGPAAQLMYENATADRLTVYVTASLPDKANAFEFTKVDGLDAFYWANNAITCTVVGDLPQDQMQTVARRVYQQMTWRPDRPYRG
jgi:anti-sigma factor RsiW